MIIPINRASLSIAHVCDMRSAGAKPITIVPKGNEKAAPHSGHQCVKKESNTKYSHLKNAYATL